jgi:hypothetical protein
LYRPEEAEGNGFNRMVPIARLSWTRRPM